MSHQDETQAERPTPSRPSTAWQAWELTVGHIHQYHSADATLRLEIHPLEYIIGWDAALTWGNDTEKVTDRHAFSIALEDLWAVLEQNHRLLTTYEAAARRPVNYTEEAILDETTYSVFSSLVNATDTVFTGDWQIIIVYRPIETPAKRVQTRLTADNHQVNKAGNGPTLREACRELLRNAAPVFHQYKIKQTADD